MKTQRRVSDGVYSINRDDLKNILTVNEPKSVLKRAACALETFDNDNGIRITKTIGKEVTSFRIAIDNENITKTSFIETGNCSDLLAEAVKHWVRFARAATNIGDEGAKVFAKIDDTRAVVHFIGNTSEIL